ncbi:hypothetical protein GCM10027614_02240 [Micromonospora vulcania]
MLQANLAPGDASSAEPWAHPSTECAIVVTGEVVAEIGGESYTLTAGEAVTFDSRLAHLYRNASDRPAHLIIAVTPPTPDTSLSPHCGRRPHPRPKGSTGVPDRPSMWTNGSSGSIPRPTPATSPTEGRRACVDPAIWHYSASACPALWP